MPRAEYSSFRINFYPDSWADPKRSSTLEPCNLHHRSIGLQNWGFYFLDPFGVLGTSTARKDQQRQACRGIGDFSRKAHESTGGLQSYEQSLAHIRLGVLGFLDFRMT